MHLLLFEKFVCCFVLHKKQPERQRLWQNVLARSFPADNELTCEYDELSENNLLNQILKTTVMLLLHHARVDQAYKSDLKMEMLFFSNIDTIDPSTIRWSAIRFQRNNNTYRMLISLCQPILEGILLPIIDEQRMNRLYEKFTLEYYAKECPQVTATASQIPWRWTMKLSPCFRSCKAILCWPEAMRFWLLMPSTIHTPRRPNASFTRSIPAIYIKSLPSLNTIIRSQRESASWSSMILNDEVSANAILKRATKH